ncbi:transmembrane protein C1orf162 homolog [Desmodus rotundus]|uniref:transmembrane protein C1orf162 homolog n=1 Tax=Desmodus rotundus TaxID=9430 RepID=UPI000D17EA06|nr:transmembrane protein C1orf162 homolog [Desmodus rotundus]
MGGGSSQPECNSGQTKPTATTAPHFYSKKELHLVLAFLAGILLALLLMTIVFLLIKSYRKCRSRPQALDPHSDSLAEFSSTPDKPLSSAGTDFKIAGETRDGCSADCPGDASSVVYAQIRVASSP